MLFELDEGGRAARVLGVVQDITDRVRLVEELRQSRARILDAGARERLRLERDLHDGAQNTLVAIELKLALAREEAGEGAVATRLEDISDHMRAAIEEVRALAHGIYPRELRDGGLDQALRTLADAAPVDARLIAEDVGRQAPTIEEAIYFCAREAIQNAAKHAGTGAQVTVSLKRREGGLELEVIDDGPGFGSGRQADGYGLASMHDRIAAVGGEFETISAAGQGARVRAIVPTAVTWPARRESDRPGLPRVAALGDSTEQEQSPRAWQR
jgi:signal transduction histidine kinase